VAAIAAALFLVFINHNLFAITGVCHGV
jgi:hypothetical protein